MDNREEAFGAAVADRRTLLALVDLSAAWDEVWAAMPKGWWFHGVNSATDHSIWSAGASTTDGDHMTFGRGPTPAAALRALRAALRPEPAPTVNPLSNLAEPSEEEVRMYRLDAVDPENRALNEAEWRAHRALNAPEPAPEQEAEHD
jgi:hypothetical protein